MKNVRGKAKQAAQSHRANIQRAYMSEVARANGDESLVRQLEAEINYN